MPKFAKGNSGGKTPCLRGGPSPENQKLFFVRLQTGEGSRDSFRSFFIARSKVTDAGKKEEEKGKTPRDQRRDGDSDANAGRTTSRLWSYICCIRESLRDWTEVALQGLLHSPILERFETMWGI